MLANWNHGDKCNYEPPFVPLISRRAANHREILASPGRSVHEHDKPGYDVLLHRAVLPMHGCALRKTRLPLRRYCITKVLAVLL